MNNKDKNELLRLIDLLVEEAGWEVSKEAYFILDTIRAIPIDPPKPTYRVVRELTYEGTKEFIDKTFNSAGAAIPKRGKKEWGVNSISSRIISEGPIEEGKEHD